MTKLRFFKYENVCGTHPLPIKWCMHVW